VTVYTEQLTVFYTGHEVNAYGEDNTQPLICRRVSSPELVFYIGFDAI
jgi:hypothetical protein